MLKFNCTCGKHISFDPSMAGKSGRCPRCKSSIRIPMPAPEASAPGPAPSSAGLEAVSAGGGKGPLLIGLSVGLLLVVGGAVAAVKLMGGKAAPTDQQARAPQVEPEPGAPTAKKGRSLRYNFRSEPRSRRRPEPKPEPTRPEPTRPEPKPVTKARPTPKPEPKPVTRAKPRPTPEPKPVTQPKPEMPPLPKKIGFTHQEAARAVGKRINVKLKDGTTIHGEVLQLAADRLVLKRSGAQVGVKWSRVDFETFYQLKWQVVTPGSGSGFFTLALNALAAGRGLLARRALRKAKRNDPSVEKRFEPYQGLLTHLLREASAPLLRQGVKYVKEGNLLHGLGKFKEARKIHDGPEASNGIGEVYYRQRKVSEAISHFDRALELNARYLPALLNRGYVHFFDQRYQLAKQDFDRALKVSPGNKVARSYAAIVQKVIDGPGWKKGYDIKTAHYFLSTDHSMAYAKRMANELEGIYKAYDKQFRASKRKNTRLRFRVIMFKTRTLYAQYTKGVTGSHFAATRTAGFYSPVLKQLVLWDNKTVVKTLYHEGFHQFLDYFLENPPRWFNEGLAEVFEVAEKQRDGSFRFFLVNRKDLPRVQSAMRRGKAMKIEQLINLPVPQFYKQAQVTYPLSWSLCYFLIHGDKGAYRRLMTRYFQALLEGESFQEAYQKAFGRVDMAKLNQRWQAYILKLK